MVTDFQISNTPYWVMKRLNNISGSFFQRKKIPIIDQKAYIPLSTEIKCWLSDLLCRDCNDGIVKLWVVLNSERKSHSLNFKKKVRSYFSHSAKWK